MSQGNYENEGFDSDSVGRATDERRHLLKLSIDFLSVKDLAKTNGSLLVHYSLKLAGQTHGFKS